MTAAKEKLNDRFRVHAATPRKAGTGASGYSRCSKRRTEAYLAPGVRCRSGKFMMILCRSLNRALVLACGATLVDAGCAQSPSGSRLPTGRRASQKQSPESARTRWRAPHGRMDHLAAGRRLRTARCLGAGHCAGCLVRGCSAPSASCTTSKRAASSTTTTTATPGQPNCRQPGGNAAQGQDAPPERTPRSGDCVTFTIRASSRRQQHRHAGRATP